MLPDPGLAQRAHYSQGALCEAARGHRLPTWEATKAFVKGCGGDQQQWRARWEAAAEIGGDSNTAAASGGADDAVTAPSDVSDVREPLPNGDVPPLSSLTSPQEFHLALRALRTRVGNPSLRDLSVSARKNGDHVLPRSTLSDALARTDRLPSLEIVEAFLGACDVQATEVDAVRSAWARVAYLQQRNSMPGGTRWEDSCPYRGLAAFTEDQAEVFYGRENMTSELLAKLAKRVRGGVGMLVVTGPSGAGKSSLLRAGLLPALANGKLGPGSQDWPRLVITPGSAPLDTLAVHLAQLAGVNNAEVRESLAERPDKAHLSARQALLARAAQQAGSEPTVSPSRLLLIVDQFEELFTGVSDKAEREAFITSLCAMAGMGCRTTELPPAIVVLGLRADFFSDCTAYAPLAETLGSGMFVVWPMTEVELRSAITGPAIVAGLSIEDGLADNVLAELRSTGNAEGFDSGALPLLSQAMLLAWEHREGTTLTHHAYAAGGGIRSGIQMSAEAAYRTLTPAQQEAARRIFLRMVTFTDHGQPTRCPIQLNDVNVGSTTDDVNAALEEFATKRLITLDQDTAEIVHEVLVHTWKRLSSWIDQDRAWLRLHRELESAASVWEENGRDPAFLYRESRLAAVQENFNEAKSPVPPSVQSFLDSSRSHERRRTRKLRSLRNMVGLLVVVALFAGIIDLQQYYNSVELDRVNGEASATDARLLAAEHPEATMSLAVHAFGLAPKSLVTRNALLNAQSQYFTGELSGHTGAITKVAFSPDGRTLATASRDGTRLWDVVKHESITTLPSTSLVNDAEFSPDGRMLVTGGAKGIAQLWNADTRQFMGTFDNAPDATTPDNPNAEISSVTFSPDNHFLATAKIGGAARLWDVVSRRLLFTFPSSAGHITNVVYSRSGPMLATLANTDTQNIVQLWNVTDPRNPMALGTPLLVTDHTDLINAVAFSPDGKTLATAAGNGAVTLWNVGNPPHAMATLTDRTNSVILAVAFSPDGQTLVTATGDGTAPLWDLRDLTAGPGRVPDVRGGQPVGSLPVGILKGHHGPIRSVAFNRDGHTVATGGEDQITRLWDTGDRILSPPAISPPDIFDMEFSPDGRVLATAAADGTSRLWDTLNHSPIPMPPSYTGTDVAFGGNSGLLATVGIRDIATLWDIGSRRRLAILDNRIRKVVFSPNGHMLATIGTDQTIRLWDVTDPFHPAPLAPFLTGRISDVAFGPDDRMATVGTNHTAQLWDIAHRHLIATLTDPTSVIGVITQMVFSTKDGNLVTASDDGTVRRWKAATGGYSTTVRITAQSPRKQFYLVALSPDGGILATTGNGGSTTELWDMDHNGTLIATLDSQTVSTSPVRFYGRDFLATASADSTVRLWDLDPGRVTGRLCGIVKTVSNEQLTKPMPNFRSSSGCP